jgi:hypothetical protein
MERDPLGYLIALPSLLYTPGGPLVIALVAFAVIVIVQRVRRVAPPMPAAGSGRRTFIARGLTIGASALILTYAATVASAIFLSEPWQVRWWYYTNVIAVAAIVVAVLLVVLVRVRVHREGTVTPITPRNWLTFTAARDRAIAGTAFGLLAVTCICAGLASSQDANGQYAIIAIGVGDSSGTATFFGWAYGVPVLVVLVVLATLVFASLRANAHPPFVSAETVDEERSDRRETSAMIVGLSTAAVTTALGQAWAMIGSSGTGSVGVGIPGVGTFTSTSGYAAIAPAMLVVSGLLTMGALLYLLLAVRKGVASARSARRAPVVVAA